MDDIDIRLLNHLQEDIPIVEHPFLDIGEKLGISEDEVLNRVTALISDGVIKRVGPSINPRKIGYTSTLVAMHVPDDKIESAVDFINKYPEITHNYKRDDHFNVWFTVIASDNESINRIIDEIKKQTETDDVMNLPATRFFKLRAKFEVD